MKKLIVVGGGGFAKEVIWLANDCGYHVYGVLDDNTLVHGKRILDVPILGYVSDWASYSDCEFIVAIGSPRTRKLVVEKMNTLGIPEFATLVHPTVIKSNQVTFDIGCMVCAGMVFTVEITVGKHCIFNINGTVGHETQVGDYVTIAPIVAISGNVNLQDCVEVGTGASIRQGVTLSKGAMLGMGGVLTKNIPENYIYAGNPAKPLKELPAA
ncbi:acetyltransferase [Shewanella xiamenensis]|uniref:acetyltransferase n=1 Tax=Shewanella xiamenensis TaxID=332186 RepID=UPI00313BD8FB